MTRFRHAILRRLSGRTVALPFVALAVLTTFACSLDKLTAPKDDTTNPTFAIQGDTTMSLGATLPLTISSSAGGTVTTTTAALYWDTDDEAVATVDHGTGVVTAVGIGTVTISATVIAQGIGEKSAEAKTIRVRYAGIKITAIDSMIAIGMTKIVQVRGTNAAGAVQAVIPFTSALQLVSRDPTIYDVNSSGSLVSKVNGTARLFAQFDNLKDSVNVKVRQVARSLTFPTAVNNELAIQSLNKDRALQLTPKDSLGVAITGSTIGWTTSDATTVTINATTGLARGLKLGTAKIKATVDGKLDSIVARVTQVAGVINKVAGDAQSATVGNAVTTVPLVAVLDSGNTPIPNAAVTFAVASGGGSVTGATPTAATNGQAAVGSWTLGTTAGANTLTASSDGASATFTATGTPGVATKLIFTTQPSNSASGAALTTFRVAVADANDNVVTTATNSITVSLASGPGAIGGTQTVAAVAGVAAFSAVTLSATGSYTITAAATSLTSVTSNSFAVFGPAAKLGFTTQPVGNTATIPMATFRVAVQDAAGNTVTSGAASTATVTLTLNTGSFTAASTVSTPAVAGVATFSNVSAAAAGTFTIGASSTGLTAATSTSFTIAAVGPATKLAFTVQPANGTAGAALADIKVTVQDANGVTNPAGSASITLGIETNVGGASISLGTTTVAASAGVATFSGIALNKAGTGYRLNATATGLTKGVSNTFNIVAGPAFKLGFASAMPNAVVATAITPSVQVQVQDANGNLVSSATNSISIGVSSGTGTLSGGGATAAVGGVATFSGLALSAAGTYALSATTTGLQNGTSTSFSVVTDQQPIKLGFLVQPSNVAAGSVVSPNIQVAIQRADGSTVTTATSQVTLSIATGPNGGSITNFQKNAVAGIATFDLAALPLAGTGYSLNAVSTGLTSATSTTFNVNPGAATKLAWVVQPATTTAGIAFANDLQVAILDGSNNVVTTATNTVAITYGVNPGGGGIATLKGTLSVPAVNGIATFTGIRPTRTATGFTLFASTSGLTGATSVVWDVTPGPAVGLTFKQNPSFVTAGAQQTTSIQVAVADSLGNTVTTATNPVTLAINSGPAGALLTGTATQPAVAGVATFADVTFTKQGNHTLSATSTDLSTTTSSSFFVTAAAPTKLAFSIQPTNTFVNAPQNPGTSQVQVQIQDTFGNQANSNATITVAFGTVPAAAAGATLNGTLANAASFGSMNLPSDVTISKAGNGFTLTATATGFTSATSDLFNVAAFSTPNQLRFIQQPADVNPGAAFTAPISVGITDSYGNVVTSAAPLLITIGCNSNCTQSNNQATTSNGLATFSTYTISTAGVYTLFESSNLYGGSASSSFNVNSTTVATTSINSTGAYDIAVSGTTAYFIERAAGTGAIKSVPAAGGTPTTLASSLNNPAALLTDGINVFWIEDGTGLVKRIPVGGGAVTTMSTAMTNMGQVLQSDGTNLFFIANNAGNTQREIKKLAMNAAAGTTPTSYVTATCGTTCSPTFTITGTTMYFWRNSDNTISSIPTGIGAPTAVVSGVTTEPGSMTFGNNRVWFVNSGILYSAPTNVGLTGFSDHGQFLGSPAPNFLFYNGTQFYALDQQNGSIRRLAGDFSSSQIMATIVAQNSRGIAFDGTFLYFADNSSPTKIRRINK